MTIAGMRNMYFGFNKHTVPLIIWIFYTMVPKNNGVLETRPAIWVVDT